MTIDGEPKGHRDIKFGRPKHEDRPIVDVRWLGILEGAVKKRLLKAVREKEPLEEVTTLWKLLREIFHTKLVEAYYGEESLREQE